MMNSGKLKRGALMAALLVCGSMAASEESVALRTLSAELCATCHQEIYQQWKGSMHAKSTALSDPIHGAFYRQEVGSPTEEGQVHKKSGTFPVCLQCHAPNAAVAKTTKLDAQVVYAEGVNCIACHTLAKFKGVKLPDGKLQLGLKAYELSDRLQGPRGMNDGLAKLAASGDDPFGGAGVGDPGSPKPNPHLGAPVEYEGKTIPALPIAGNSRLMQSSDVCMGCHDQRDNPQGVPLCQTGNEYMESASKVNCLSCHMQIHNGLADHSMNGGHHQPMVARGVIFDVAATPDGERLKAEVYLKNQLPHSMPTGAPFRNLVLRLTAYDAQGNAVWRNSATHPAKDDPKAYLSYSMVDDQGMPAPPPTATKAGADTRLKPHEERTITYEIPAATVALVRGELYYNLLWPELVEKFGPQLPKELLEPMLIGVAEVPLATP